MAARDSLLPDHEKPPRILENSHSLESCSEPGVTECDTKEVGYGIGDALFTSFAVAPLVVATWRGTWTLMNLYSDYFPFVQTFLLGIVVHSSFAMVRAQLLARSAGAWGKHEGGAGRWLRERFLSKVYTYIFILANINHWRGGWGIMDLAIGAILPNDKDPHRPVLYAAITIACYLCMIALRSSRNVLASPYFLVTDGKEATYIFTTRFEKKISCLSRPYDFLFDDDDLLPFTNL